MPLFVYVLRDHVDKLTAMKRCAGSSHYACRRVSFTPANYLCRQYNAMPAAHVAVQITQSACRNRESSARYERTYIRPTWRQT